MMRTLIIAACLAVGSGWAMAQSTPPAAGTMTMSQAQCDSLWNKVDSGKSGSLTQAQAQPYVSDFKSADTNNDGKLSSTEFQSACQRGLAKDTATSGSSTGSSSTGK